MLKTFPCNRFIFLYRSPRTFLTSRIVRKRSLQVPELTLVIEYDDSLHPSVYFINMPLLLSYETRSKMLD